MKFVIEYTLPDIGHCEGLSFAEDANEAMLTFVRAVPDATDIKVREWTEADAVMKRT